MLTLSEHPETLDEVQQSIQRWFGESSEGVSPFTFSRGNGSADILCLMSDSWGDLKVSTAREWVLLEMKHSRLRLNLDKFFVTTAVDGARVCLNIEPEPESEHRVLSWVLQDIAETKHPAFQSRILRAFLNLEEDLPSSTIEEATGAPTDFLVALEALSSAPGTAQLIADDPLLAAKIRGLKRKRQMLEIAGGALSSGQVAEVLGISRQAVDKRRSANQLLALTQGRRGYSYPSFQFDDGRTIRGLEQVLGQLAALDPWMQMAFFTSPNERLGGSTPIEGLQKGLIEDVANAASGYGEQGSL
jgi:hypothetical protein